MTDYPTMIARGKTKEALELACKDPQLSDQRNSLILLLSRQNDIDRQIMLGTIDNSSANITKNQILSGFLGVLKTAGIMKGDIDQQPNQTKNTIAEEAETDLQFTLGAIQKTDEMIRAHKFDENILEKILEGGATRFADEELESILQNLRDTNLPLKKHTKTTVIPEVAKKTLNYFQATILPALESIPETISLGEIINEAKTQRTREAVDTAFRATKQSIIQGGHSTQLIDGLQNIYDVYCEKAQRKTGIQYRIAVNQHLQNLEDFIDTNKIGKK